jgi:hypothetical protein
MHFKSHLTTTRIGTSGGPPGPPAYCPGVFHLRRGKQKAKKWAKEGRFEAGICKN